MKSHLFSFVLSALALATFSSCSTTIRVSALNPIAPIYSQGNPVLVSKKKNEVSVGLLSERIANDPGMLPEFLVVLVNSSGTVIDFSTDNITANSGGKPVRVYTYDKLRRHIANRAAMLAFAGAMNGAAQSIAASAPQTSYSTGTVSAYGSGGYARGTYTAQTTTYNPAASAAAVSTINANTSNNIRNIVASRDSALSDTTSMLRRDTIMPGNAAGGVVKLYAQDLRLGKTLVLTVTVSGESHDFYFDIGKPAPTVTTPAQP